MAQPGFIFGGNTGMTYDQVQKQRDIANELLRANMNTPRNVGEGLSAIGRALAAKAIDKRTTRADDDNRRAYEATRDSIFSSLGGFGSAGAGGSAGGGIAAPAPPPVAPIDPTSPDKIGFDAMKALGKPVDFITYQNQGATRSQPLAPELAQAVSFLPEMGVSMEVFSGGQPGINEGGPRVGSTRHDHGNAADVFFSKDGRRLDWQNPNDIPILQEIVQRGRAAGLTGFGAGDGYMQPGSMHIGFGPEAVWGAGGQGENAPEWLRQAFYGGGQPGPAQPQGGAPTQPQAVQGMANPAVLMALAEVQGNPYASASDKAIAAALMDQTMQAMNPMRALEMERARLEVEQLRNPEAKGVVVNGRIVDPSDGRVIYQPQPGEAGGTEYGLQPQYGVDAEGNPVIIQIGKDGTATQTRLPEGVTFQKEPIRVDGGTEWILLDPITRQPVGSVPKQLREAAAETEIGKAEGAAEGAAITGAGGNTAQVEEAVALIDSIMNDPALPSITGMVQGRLPPLTQAGTDLNVKVKQLQGKAFLEAFESLKGGGAITEMEGKAATEAMARLDRAQSEEAYRAALAELKGIMQKGAERMRARAGLPGAEASAPDAAAPAPGGNDFSSMTAEDLMSVDVSTLSPAELQAMLRRLDEVGQ